MLTTVLFLRYNNYYNRQLKRLETAQDYEEYILDAQPNCNFIPNDGITTEFIMNSYDGEIPDYVLVLNPGTIEITSRWFVIEAVRNCKGQFVLTLFRDTLADYYNEIQDAPIFIEKAMLHQSNPLIFNQEDMTVNQIRQEPILLKDASNIPWIVGYIPRDAVYENQVLADMNIDKIDFEVNNISNWEYYKYKNPSYIDAEVFTQYRYSKLAQTLGYMNKNVTLQIFNNYDDISEESWQFNSKAEIEAQSASNPNPDFKNGLYYRRSQGTNMKDFKEAVRTNSTYKSYVDGFSAENWRMINDVQKQEILELDNKTIRDTTTDEKFKISVILEQVEEEKTLINEQAMKGFLAGNIPDPKGGSINEKTFALGIKGYKIYIKLEQFQSRAFVNISSPEVRYHLEDDAYDMFCIPFGDITINTSYEIVDGHIRKGSINGTNPGTAIATQIGALSGSGAIYDVQILPYCPVPSLVNEDGEIDAYKSKFDIIYSTEGKAISTVIWCRNSRFTINIPYSIPDEEDAILKKIHSQTKIFRLVSPNYGSIFEFNPYKNGGVEFFRVDAAYRPFNPYIKIAPVFGGLYGYGGSYDGRGLILSGDFSLTQLSNAWANYELQNKNYESIFNRQIENMEVGNKYQRINDIAAAITGSGGAAAGGAMAGAMVGGKAGAYGAIAGATAGATAGIATGIADVFLKEQLRTEAIDYTKDQFGYNLGNIQAIPTAISKTTAITSNNPLVPMLEIYDCTDTEKNAFKNKIKYNGMTVMAIGTMNEFSEGYFKGKLIRLEDIADDFHMVNVISEELNKGVYL